MSLSVRRLIRYFDRRLDRFAPPTILVLAGVGVLIVEGVDFVTGYEVSLSLLYLGPIAIAAWYAGRWPGFVVAALSCVGWYVADQAAGSEYSNAAIPVWNALVRLGFFVITAHLLTALRDSLRGHQRLSRTDGLTGLYRRRVFEERFEHDLALARRNSTPVTLAYLDVDDFKAVNDAYGHAGGDRVLTELGRILRDAVREVDTAARLGGDEFALVLPDTDARGARRIIAKLTEEFGEAMRAASREVTCSVGVVTFRGGAASLDQAVAIADELMYRVKRGGKGAAAFEVRGDRAHRSRGIEGHGAPRIATRDEAAR